MSTIDVCCCCSTDLPGTKKSYCLSTSLKDLPGLKLGEMLLECAGVDVQDFESFFVCGDCRSVLVQYYNFRQKVLETYRKLVSPVKLEVKNEENEIPAAQKRIRKERLPQRKATLEMYKRGEDGLYSCAKCPSKFSFIGRLERHVEAEHSHEGQNAFKCEECEAVFPVFKEIRKHIGEVHTLKPFSCDICGRNCPTYMSIKSHIIRMHLGIGRGSSAAKSFCSICGKCSSSKEALARHIKHKHMPKELIPKPYECSICGLKWRDKSSLNKHVQLHFNTTEWECEKCGKKLASKYGLLNHISWVHEGERKWCCDVCGKAFKGKAGLQEHLRTHSDEKPFKCDICEASFKSANTLRTHKKLLHTENTEVSCGICGKVFKNSACLKSHSYLHTATDLPCHICGKVYKVKDSLNRHIRAFHEGIKKRHRCKLCGHNLWSRKNVVEHIELQHDRYLKDHRVAPDELVERYLTSETQSSKITCPEVQ